MGFRNNSFATVWSVEPLEKTTRVRISTSRKNKQTNQYEQDFSGFCLFIGQANECAASLNERDRIRIGECEVTTYYDKQKQREYVTYKVYNFEMADGSSPGGNSAPPKQDKPSGGKRQPAFGIDGDSGIEGDIPF